MNQCDDVVEYQIILEAKDVDTYAVRTNADLTCGYVVDI